MAESGPGTCALCAAADGFQGRAGFCANITNPLQRPDAEQIVLLSTFLPTVQPQELSRCPVTHGLVPHTGFREPAADLEMG